MNAQTAAAVREVIQRLGYRTDPIARSLSTGRGRFLGVLTHEIAGSGTLAILAGVEQAAREAGYGLSIASVSTFEQRGMAEGVDRLLRSGCEALIIMAPLADDAALLQSLILSVPVVTTSEVEGYAGPSVHVNAVESAEAVVRYLLQLGHKTVRHVSGEDGWNASQHRIQGWQRALVGAGAEVLPPIRGDWTARSGYAAGLRLAEDPATAVFAANDHMALGVIQALSEHGIRVPQDVSVAGYDDIEGAEFFRPALTTVSVDTLMQGRVAVEQLLNQIDGRMTNSRLYIPYELVVRASCAPPRASLTPTK